MKIRKIHHFLWIYRFIEELYAFSKALVYPWNNSLHITPHKSPMINSIIFILWHYQNCIFGNKNALESSNNWTFTSSLFYNKIGIIHPTSLLCLKFYFIWQWRYCVLSEKNLKAFALIEHELLALEFFIFCLLEYFHPKKLLTLHANYYQSLTAIKTGPKNLEYFILCLYTLKIRIYYVVINFK